MSWICPICSTCNEDGAVQCIVCDTDAPGRVCTLTRARVVSLGLSGDVVIPSEFNVIGEGAFKNRSDVTSVTLHARVRKIEKEAFMGCERLCSIVADVKPETISKRAFADCKALPVSRRIGAAYVAPDAYVLTAPVTVPERAPMMPEGGAERRSSMEGDGVRATVGRRVAVARGSAYSLSALLLAALFSLVPLISLLVFVLQSRPGKSWNDHAFVMLAVMLVGELILMVRSTRYREILKETQTTVATVLFLASLLLFRLMSKQLRWICLVPCFAAFAGCLYATYAMARKKPSLAALSFIGVLAVGIIVIFRIFAWL